MAQGTMQESWIAWRKRRALLFCIGKISGLFFLCAVLAVLDGVQGLIMQDSDEIRLLAGGQDGVSGPCPFPNPVESDLLVNIPKGAPLTFTLEGYFAGYMLGNGMWRGVITADPDAPTCEAKLSVSFRGTMQEQKFKIRIYADADALRGDSPYYMVRLLACNPFILAGIVFLIALFFGSITYLLSKKNAALLVSLGYAEIFRVKREKDETLLWCSAYGSTLTANAECPILHPDGSELGRARLAGKEKNVLRLSTPVPDVFDGCLVCVCKEKSAG